ncbi:peptide/nickel transport system substrate-binding protein [Blastococcus aggregatus]|uniref:Peptide/nickel transport system substrate-binding protein n=1 Tax=Blastococcus aggregatus TaxID=38502 RepID=A0A285V704_9ACTN|nr:ABC transporter substrate-binding protein [Blastococcus aggregatus]SOC49793.1 peptide/nickel transport system substrate-binding protein [Blastococcus aggregatus]
MQQHRRPMRGPWKRALVSAGLVGLLLGSAACGSGDEDSNGDAEAGAVSDVGEAGDPVTGGSITVGLEAETNSWLPSEGTFNQPGTNVAYAIYDPLMQRTADGAVEPYLAESMEPNAELTAWTLKLRPEVQFHDGTALDAQALKTIFDDYLKVPGSRVAASLAEVSSLDVVDDLTVTYQLTEPNAAFPDELVTAAGWPFSPTAAAAAGADAGANPVGTGPFVFESWQRDSRLVVKKNANYWQEGKPYLDEIVFRPIPDEDTRLASLQSGDIDVMQSLRQSTVVRARDLDGVSNFEYLGSNSGGTTMNTSKAPFDDVRVRQAMAYAMDQDALIEVLGGSGVTPKQTQFFSPDSPYYSEALEESYPTYDMAKAQELYDSYVEDPERSDGKAVGSPISFTFQCPPDPSLNELSQLYQAFFNALGAEVTLQQTEQAAWIQDMLARDYEMGCTRVGADRDPYIVFSQAFTEGPLNMTAFQSPEIDEQLDVLKTTVDTEARKAAVEAIGEVLNEQVPNTFSGGTLTVMATRDAVKNLDGWTFPEGTPGNGAASSQIMWGHVWVTD